MILKSYFWVIACRFFWLSAVGVAATSGDWRKVVFASLFAAPFWPRWEADR